LFGIPSHLLVVRGEQLSTHDFVRKDQILFLTYYTYTCPTP